MVAPALTHLVHELMASSFCVSATHLGSQLSEADLSNFSAPANSLV